MNENYRCICFSCVPRSPDPLRRYLLIRTMKHARVQCSLNMEPLFGVSHMSEPL